MKNGEHLWAVAYDDMERANQVRDEIVRPGVGRAVLHPE